jgi:hypothetical protein
MNWVVKVKTKNNYIKDVIVNDYCYPTDAIDAALAQTDSTEYISCVPYCNETKNSFDVEYQESQYISTSPRRSNVTGTEELTNLGLIVLGTILCIVAFPLGLMVFGYLSYRAFEQNTRPD